MSDVTKTTCLLKWKKPKDDGGTPISHYVIEKLNTTRGSWIEAGTSRDLTFQVKNLDALKKFHFRVKAVNSEGESEALQTEESILAKNPYGMKKSYLPMQVYIFI